MGVRKLIALAGVVASATLGVGAAAAPLARSDLVVVGDDGVTFDVETQTKQALVCNRGSQRARVRSRVAAEGQRTTQVRVTPDEFVLRPGRCRELTLAVSGVSVDNLDPGSVILLSRRGAAEISYTATEAASPTTATFAEALGPTKFHVQRNRWVFGPDQARLDSRLMAVRYDSAPESIPTQTVVMSDGDHVFSVEAEALDPDDAVVRFVLAPDADGEGLSPVNPAPGNYKGTLVLGVDKTVPLTVEVDDSRLLFACLLALFVLAGAFLKYWSDRVRFSARLERQRDRLRGLYGEGALIQVGTDNYLPPTGEAIREWRYRNERAQREYFKTVVAPNPADPAFLKIVEAISDAQKDAAVFRTSLPESLRKLRRVADDVEVWRSAVREESAAPALWSMKDGIRAVLDGPSVRGLGGGAGQPTPLGIGQATKVKARADTLVELAEAWLRQAEHVIRVAQWLILVRQAVTQRTSRSASTDR